MLNNECTVCAHPERVNIDAEIVAGSVLSAVARQYSVPDHCIRYHARHHMPRDPSKEAVKQREATLEDIRINKERLEKMLTKSIRDGHISTSLKVLGEMRMYVTQEASISAQNQQLRIRELELELSELRAGLSDAADATDWAVFSDIELRVFIRLSDKMISRDKSDTVIDCSGQFISNVRKPRTPIGRLPSPGRLNGRNQQLLERDAE